MYRRLGRLLSLAAVAAAPAAASGDAAEIDPAAMTCRLASRMAGRDNPANPGLKQAVLYGGPSKPGPCSVRVKWRE